MNINETNSSRTIYNSLYLSIYILMCVFYGLKIFTGYETLFRYILLLYSFFPMLLGEKLPISGVLLCFCGSILAFIRGNLPNNLFFWVTAPLLAQYILHKKFNIWILYLTFLLISSFFFQAGIRGDLDNIMIISDNFVSVIFLFNSALIVWIIYQQTGKMDIIPFVITFILSIMATGRGGILCSTICLVGMIVLKVESLNSKKWKLFLFFLIAVVIVLLIPIVTELYEQADYLERMRSRGLHDHSREMIWTEYFKSLNFERFIMGYDLSQNSFIHSYGDNPHNSYIKLHSNIGIFVLIPFVYIVYSMFRLIKKKEFIYVIPLFSLLLRGYTDVIFMQQYDYIVIIAMYQVNKIRPKYMIK